jgi:ribosome-associated toxin RatA of RatAB toxin-antitoxin module
MKKVKKSVLLWYSPSEMFELVAQVENYPRFLPWCERADILSATDQEIVARLHLAFAGLRHSFTTRNHLLTDRRLTMELVEGPFSVLQGSWDFLPLALPEQTVQPGPIACKILFELHYAFSSKPLEVVLSPVFDRIANTFVESFVKRAEAVYGPR